MLRVAGRLAASPVTLGLASTQPLARS